MSGGRDAIFLITEDDKLRRVDRSPYENEEKLHSLMRDHPDLILGDQINPREPVRWLLVRLEAGIPDAQDAGDRWALDMLLVDHKGVPTFVEIKLSTDTRIRREVVKHCFFRGSAGKPFHKSLFEFYGLRLARFIREGLHLLLVPICSCDDRLCSV